MEEKRAFTRISFNTSVFCHIEHEDQMMVGCQEAMDLSEGGLRIRTSQAIKPETPLDLILSFDESRRTMNAKAVVRWSVSPDGQGWMAGLQFIDLSPADLQKIKSCLFRAA